MPSSGGPNTLGESNLIFAIDTNDTSNGITPLGCGGFNGSTQGVKNLLNGTTYQFINGMKLSGRDYFTAFAIDYPEGSFGGDAAGRNGIAQGYNVRSGPMLFTFGRALNYAVYNNATNTWVKTTVYDSYVGTAAVDTFVSEYATAINTYPDATHVIAGSHRDSNHTSAQYAILKDLGAPSNVESIIGFSSPEWILVGKPGLGTGNAFGWVFQNYETNPDQVAHINFGLPIKARGEMVFDGTDDYINAGNLGSISDFTVEIIFKSNSVSNYRNPIDCNWLIYNGSYSNLGPRLEQTSTGNLGWVIGDIAGNVVGVNVVSSGLDSSKYHHVTITRTESSFIAYYNGAQSGTTTFNNWYGSFSNVTIGRGFSTSGERWFTGNIPVVKIYNRALTTSEVKQNYQQYKTRFNLS